MNIDLLGNNNVNWWWYAILSVAVFIMVLMGWACIKHYGVCIHILEIWFYVYLTYEPDS